MRLVYTDTGKEVQVGDKVTLRSGEIAAVNSFPKPHKPASGGIVYITTDNESEMGYYTAVIGAEWIEREDRAMHE